MRKTFFTTFQLGSSKDPLKNLKPLSHVLKKWLRKPNRGFNFPINFDFMGNDLTIEEKGHKLYKHYFRDTSVGELLALRYEHPDSQSEDVIWRIDIVFGESIFPKDIAFRFAMNVWYGSKTQEFKPIYRYHSKPSLIIDLIKSVGAFELYQLQAGFIPLPQNEIPLFIGLLSNLERKLPIIFISRESESNQPIVDINLIIKNCSGLAYIILNDDNNVTWEIQSYLGKVHNCYDGAVRIYWPGFKVTDNPFTHTLWTKDRIIRFKKTKGGFENYLFNKLCEHAECRYVNEYLTWDGAEKIDRQLKLNKIKESGTLEKWTEILENENADLTAQNKGLQIENQKLKSDLFDLRKENEQLLLSIKFDDKKEIVLEESYKFESFHDVIYKFNKNYSEFVVLEKRSIKDQDFEDLESLYKALIWLALTYRKVKKKELQIENLDHSCRESCGFKYIGNQSVTTMGQFKDDYFYKYKRRNMPLKEHIGTGSSKHPEHTIRIAFFFDEEDQKVVIGYLGQHQRTKAT